jgi:hypothetical protein
MDIADIDRQHIEKFLIGQSERGDGWCWHADPQRDEGEGDTVLRKPRPAPQRRTGRGSKKWLCRYLRGVPLR